MEAATSQQRTPGVGPIASLLLGIAAFVVIYVCVHFLSRALLAAFPPPGVRASVALHAATGVVLDWAMLGAVVLILRLRGQGLRDLGWGNRSPLRGWLIGFAVAVFYCAFTFMGPALRHAPVLTDWSVFRIGTALALGLTAGICEEAVFRGFVMTETRDAGFAAPWQVLASAVLFGCAHFGWGSLGGHLQIGFALGAVLATLLLGALLALIYLASRRSLMPAIAAHALIDIVIEPWLILFAVTGGHIG